MPDVPASGTERRLGRYRLEEERGRGGMGVVYAAYDEDLGRRVALKVLRPAASDLDPAAAERFVQEMRIALTLEHPNVVPVYETGTDGETRFIAMRLVDGEDLGAMIRRCGALHPERVARIGRQLAAALDAAHARGLVHRDVKPGNVLLTGSGDEEHVYLTDFGLTRAADGGVTQTGHWIGTVDYAAPEQIEAGAVDHRSDVYALGCVLFHALTGHPPFTGSLAARATAQVTAPLPSVGPAVAGDSAQIDAVLAVATAKEPGRRHASAGALGRAFARAVAAAGTDQATAAFRAATGDASSAPGDDPPSPGAAGERAATVVQPARRRDPLPAAPPRPRERASVEPPTPTRVAPAAPVAAGAAAAAAGAASAPEARSAADDAAPTVVGAPGAGATDARDAPRRGRGPLFAEGLPPDGPAAARRSARERGAVVLMALGAAAAVVLVAALALGGGDGGDPASKAGASSAKAATTPRKTTSTPRKTTSTTAAATPARIVPLPTTRYTAPAGGYSADVPTGEGWAVKGEEKLNGILRTTVLGPDGQQLWIDATPTASPSFGRAGRSVTEVRTISGPLGAITGYRFSGEPAAFCAGGCADYQLDLGGHGFAVIAGPTPQARDAARRTILSLTPTQAASQPPPAAQPVQRQPQTQAPAAAGGPPATPGNGHGKGRLKHEKGPGKKPKDK